MSIELFLIFSLGVCGFNFASSFYSGLLSKKSTLILLKNDLFLIDFIKNNTQLISNFKIGSALGNDEEILIESISHYIKKTKLVSFYTPNDLLNALILLDKEYRKNQIENLIENNRSPNNPILIEEELTVIESFSPTVNIENKGENTTYEFYKNLGYETYKSDSILKLISPNDLNKIKNCVNCYGNIVFLGTDSITKNDYIFSTLLNSMNKYKDYKNERLLMLNNMEFRYDLNEWNSSEKPSFILVERKDETSEYSDNIYINNSRKFCKYRKIDLIIKVDAILVSLNSQFEFMAKIEVFNH